jgi:hypothetical protein
MALTNVDRDILFSPFDFKKPSYVSDCVRWHEHGPARPGQPAQARERRQTQHGGNEEKLPGLDADVEEEERFGNMSGGHPDLAQRAGKAEAVQQSEDEGDQPRHPCRHPHPALPRMNDLDGDECDRKCDHRLHWRRRDVDEAERRCCKGDAMCCGKGGDGLDELSGACRDQDEAEHEKQMIDAEEDVTDAELQIGRRHLPNVLPRRNPGLWQRRGQTLDPGPSVGELDPHEGVGHRVLKPVDPDLLAGERFNGPNLPGLHQGVVRAPRQDRRRRLDPTGESDIEREPQVALHRRLEQHVEYAGRYLL